MKKYTVTYYGPDGSDVEREIARGATLDEARDAVRECLGLDALADERRWDPPDAVEGWHELLRTDPDSEGCGGCVICEHTEG